MGIISWIVFGLIAGAIARLIMPGKQPGGCLITYPVRILRISELPGAMVAFKIPGLRALGLRIGGSNSRKGLRGLARLAEELANAR